MNANELFDLDLLAACETDGYIRRRRHPILPLSILNYTEKAQWEKAWNPVTTTCRGLIVDDDGQVVARPFPKFHNLAEHQGSHPDMVGPFRVFTKLDGSLGILWEYAGTWGVASRGSFDSPQALWATTWVDRLGGPHPAWPTDATVLMEIIYPENRVVVDYGRRAECVVLAVIDKATGKATDRNVLGLTHVDEHDPGDLAPADVVKLDPSGEGFVLYWPETGFRVKVKHDEYVRLHRLITHTSPRTVWEHLAQGGTVDELATNVPDEFHEWLRATADELTDAFRDITEQAVRDYGRIGVHSDRRTFAEAAKKTAHPGLMFALLDGKDIAPFVWKLLKPDAVSTWFSRSEDES